MRASRPERIVWLAPLLLAAQGLVAWTAGHREIPPPPPDLTLLPDSAGEWRAAARNTPPPALIEALGTDRLLDRNYRHAATAADGHLFVAWYGSQLAGQRQPHSPRMCLPGSGWMPERTGEITLRTAAGTIEVNRWVVAKGGQRAAVLYWYQKPRRAVAGEWTAKFWLGVDAVRDRRTDIAFVRIVAWPGTGGIDQAMSSAESFAAAVYPQLRRVLFPGSPAVSAGSR